MVRMGLQSVIYSPFNAIDEERRKRDQELQERVAGLGSSIAKAPLTYDSLMKEAEDRKLKLAADAEALSIKRNQEKRDQEKHEFEQKKYKDEQQKYEGEKATEQKKYTDERSDKEGALKRTKQNNAVKDLVAGGLGRGLEDQQIIEESFDNPDLADVTDQATIEGEISRQRLERKNKDRDLDIKQQKADSAKLTAEAAMKRANRLLATAKKPGRPLTAVEMQNFTKLKTDLGRLSTIRGHKGQVDTGPAAGLYAIIQRRIRVEDPATAILRASVQDEINRYLKDQSGATVTPEEFARLKEVLPTLTDDDDIFEALLDAAERARMQEWNDYIDVYAAGGRDLGALPKMDPSQVRQPKKKQDPASHAANVSAIIQGLLGE